MQAWLSWAGIAAGGLLLVAMVVAAWEQRRRFMGSGRRRGAWPSTVHDAPTTKPAPTVDLQLDSDLGLVDGLASTAAASCGPAYAAASASLAAAQDGGSAPSPQAVLRQTLTRMSRPTPLDGPRGADDETIARGGHALAGGPDGTAADGDDAWIDTQPLVTLGAARGGGCDTPPTAMAGRSDATRGDGPPPR